MFKRTRSFFIFIWITRSSRAMTGRDYPVEPDNDRERKGGPLCVNKAVFLLEN
nr:MAG TPA: hypothetical protein [Caudoviricetes sp.]